MTPAKGIVDLLEASGAGFVFGGTADWAMNIGMLPDDPARVICITDSGGKPPNPAWLVDYPSVQIIVRGNAGDYQAIAEKCALIKSIVLGINSQTINGALWHHVSLASEPALLGADKNRNIEFVMNINIILEPPKTAYDSRDPL